MRDAPALSLRIGGRELTLGPRPLLMGVVNATRDSFSDAASERIPAGWRERLQRVIDAGADIVDVGGESAITGRAPQDPATEIARVVPLVRQAAAVGTLVSVDTYKPAVAAAAIAAGATIVNDTSGLRDPEMAALCARTGAALVLMHTRAAPKERLQDPGLYGPDVMADVLDLLARRIDVARKHGMAREQLIVDPGPDFAKTPAQTVATLSALERLHELARPILLAVSRKDFVGALTRRAPRARLAGSLAALAHGLDAGAHIARVHDVAEAADFLAVRSALRGADDVPASLRLPDSLRHDPSSDGSVGSSGDACPAHTA